MTCNEKNEKYIVEKQAKLLGEWVKKMHEKDKRIKELEEDVVFLKKVIALCMRQNEKPCVVYRDIGYIPDFILEENIGDETIIRMVKRK